MTKDSLKNSLSRAPEKFSLNSVIKKISEECTKCNNCFDECEFIRSYGKPKDIADSCIPTDINTMELAFECSLCGLCEAVCPVDLNPVELFFEMRRETVKQGKNDFSKYSALLSYEKKGTSKRYSWYGLPAGCESIFFPGCTLPGTRPYTTLNLYRSIKKKVPGMGIVLDCCAKISHDLGREEYFNAMFGEMKAFLIENGVKQIYTACPNCYWVFKNYGEEFSVRTVYDLIAERGIFQPDSVSGNVAVHDPCVIRHEKEIHSAVRDLIRLTGLKINEMVHSGEKTLCCGEGGFVSSVSPALVGDWSDRRLEESKGLRAITYCAGCAGKLSHSMPASHLLDLLFNPEAVMSGKERVSRPPFTYWNRLRLKKKLKKESDTLVSRERQYSFEG